MNGPRTAFAAALCATAVTVAAASASAEPHEEVSYRAAVVSDSVVTTLEHATFALDADGASVAINATDGQRLLDVPLAFLLDGQRRTIAQHISADGRTLILTPDTGIRAVASPMEDQLAATDLASKMTIGPLLGGLGGAILGALVGAVIGLGSCLVVGPACLATAPAAIGAFAAGGSLLGTLVGGGSALVDGLWKYITTVQAAPGESAYAHENGVDPNNGTGAPDATLRLPHSTLNSGSASSASG
ncbi:hypothetical protein GFY24_18365 [Nocardia sp. SYP-A9097]|uniref:hypothetical protein n=1 Tax=Nocardia sp. SYP-A9097 TaxID=2663237 RepID=UPI00129AD038|nr:hypothetical protein [Nocardia sp. SYP-A9097]MRH89389.1 hypothetical protein [Nocardia sp. SYP-A9097]